jgi:large subunit ribosomal protein L7/L12
MAEAPAKEFSAEITKLADQLVGLTVKQAQQLVDCMKEVHGIEPAGGGAVMMAAAPGAGAAAAVEEKTSFDVELTNFGENKIGIIKVIRAITGLGLKEAKDLVEAAPKVVKTGVDKAEADKIKKEITDAGGQAAIK